MRFTAFLRYAVLLVALVGCTPPVNVAPKPTPTPVNPAPVVANGRRVLIVWESSQNHTREQLNILNSTQVVGFLNANCAKVNGRAEWRRWDKSTVEKNGLAKESSVWQQLWTDSKDKLTALPVLVIASDQKATIYPMPATETAAVELLKKTVGGN